MDNLIVIKPCKVSFTVSADEKDFFHTHFTDLNNKTLLLHKFEHPIEIEYFPQNTITLKKKTPFLYNEAEYLLNIINKITDPLDHNIIEYMNFAYTNLYLPQDQIFCTYRDKIACSLKFNDNILIICILNVHHYMSLQKIIKDLSSICNNIIHDKNHITIPLREQDVHDTISQILDVLGSFNMLDCKKRQEALDKSLKILFTQVLAHEHKKLCAIYNRITSFPSTHNLKKYEYISQKTMKLFEQILQNRNINQDQQKFLHEILKGNSRFNLLPEIIKDRFNTIKRIFSYYQSDMMTNQSKNIGI